MEEALILFVVTFRVELYFTYIQAIYLTQRRRYLFYQNILYNLSFVLRKKIQTCPFSLKTVLLKKQ